MRGTAESMALFLAMVLTLGACGGPLLPPHIAGYRLDTELPEEVPDQAPIYRVVEAPTPAPEWARHVAAALGFEGEPVAYSESAAEPEWTWGKGYSSEALTVYGNIAFQCSHPPDGDTGADTLETIEEAVAAARAWLIARDLLPADCADDAQAWFYQTGPAECKLTRYGWGICFRRRLDGLPVGSCWGWRGGISMRLDTQGHVTFMLYVHREVEVDSFVPIRTVEEAWQELQAKGPAFLDTEGPMFPEYGIFTISEVALGYYEAAVGTAEVQKQFKPHYIFIGKLEVPGGDMEVRAAAYVPAWK